MLAIPKGFAFAAARAGFKEPGRLDLGVILSEPEAAAGGVFTRNRFQAAPVLVAREQLSSRETARAIAVNAGQANACTGEEGLRSCRRSLELTAGRLGLRPEEILPASTGVIGASMDLAKWEEAVAQLPSDLGRCSPLEVAKAMLTTDTFPKLAWRRLELAGGEVSILGMAKGAGMICPDMATMLCFLMADVQVESPVWREMLRAATGQSFNRITIDGDTSTNDCLLGLANGASGVRPDRGETARLQEAVTEVCRELAYFIVQDAEGGTKVVRIRIRGASETQQAEAAARALAHSPLVKTALFGEDPNWGRIVAALGRSGASFEPQQAVVSLAGRIIFQNGTPAEADLDALLKPFMERDEIDIQVDLGQGDGAFEVLTSDLSTDYVRINADYRS